MYHYYFTCIISSSVAVQPFMGPDLFQESIPLSPVPHSHFPAVDFHPAVNFPTNYSLSPILEISLHLLPKSL